ncbi:hypothetical protein JCM10296v2_006403 [Rhodotorula toruloides]
MGILLGYPKGAEASVFAGPHRAAEETTAESLAFPLRYAVLALLLPVALWLYYPASFAPAPPSTAPVAQPAVIPEAARCPAQVKPLSVGADWHPEDNAVYKHHAVERLRDARTEAFDDMGGPEDPRFEIFLELHLLLESWYPRVFSSLQVEKVRRHGLLITWQGSDPSLKPVVLMAHQDVVPVDAVTASRWTHPPFAAHLDEVGWIWGRGTTDCKNTLLGALSAFEKLLEDGHKPTRTLIISSGADEEIGGTRSAKYIAERLEERYGHDGVAFILDEGISAIDQAYGLTLARLGIAEKGAVSIKLDVFTPGGHSSVPLGPHTSIGILAKLVTTLEENPELPIMREGSPLLTELQCAADYGRLPPALKASVRDPNRWEALSRQMSAKDNIIRAFIGTTQAVDLIHGTVKINALPEFATASANYRINFLSSVNATLERLITVLRPTVESFNLTFDTLGSHADIDNNVVRFSVLPTTAHEPAPLTPTSGPTWELLAGTTRHIWEGAVVTPSGMIGGTDTKHCWNLTRNIFRFVPCSLSLALNLHTVDERLHVDAHMSTIRFYYKLIVNLEVGKEESLPLTAPAPSSSSLETTRTSSSFSRRIAALALLLPVAFWLSFPTDSLAALPVDPLNVGFDWLPEQDDEYKKLATERLQGAVRIRTESFDDMAGPEDPRFEPFGNLHTYLETTFPRVYSTLQVEKVQKYGLLLTWKGKDEGLKPVVLMAHQDTVPVPAVTEDRWTYPPFDAHLDEKGWIWGRGTADCKNTLIGIFGALDKLIEEGHSPTRTIILSSGFDEEIGGSRSAKYLASTLEERYGKDGIAWVLDEGFTGVDEAYGRTFARFGTAEKGAVSIKLDVLTPGGHASVPRRGHTGIGILAKLVSVLEEHPDVPRLREGNPLLSELMCAAEYGEVDRKWRRRVKDPKQWKKLGREMAKEDDIKRAYLSTTQATDLIHGGVKINALPEYASASINYRIDFLSSVNATLSRLSSILAPTVKHFNLTFDAYGSHSDIENDVVRLQVIEGSQIEPAPITSTEGKAWELMAGTTRHVWKDAIVGPSGMVANTDTKYSWPLTRNIYRFVPASLQLIKDFHTVDERIHVDAHLNGIRFFYKLLRNTEGWEAP